MAVPLLNFPGSSFLRRNRRLLSSFVKGRGHPARQVIMTKLIGGLGNQMFQYAIARRLALERAYRLKIDLTALRNDPLRQFGLGDLRITGDVATEEEVSDFLHYCRRGKEADRTRLAFRPPAVEITEPHFHFAPACLLPQGSVYLAGYWQSEKYFSSVAGCLREDLQVRTAAAGRNQEMLDQINDCESVSVHFRRGDYASNPEANRVHGLLDLAYYYRAVEEVSLRLGRGIQLFIFSDDPQWVRENFRPALPATLVDWNAASNCHEDLRLMYHCKHQIVANSSFSWWGGWLNKNPDKIVVAPQRWFASPGYDSSDLIPTSWLRL